MVNDLEKTSKNNSIEKQVTGCIFTNSKQINVGISGNEALNLTGEIICIVSVIYQ